MAIYLNTFRNLEKMDWLRATDFFTDVAEKKSFSAVARLRHTSPSVVTKHIDWLEERLKTKLLLRSTRYVDITAAGLKFLEYANNLQESTQQIKHELLDQQPEISGKLRITTSKFLGETLLSQCLLDFHDNYPEIELCVDASNRHVDLIHENVDVAIRVSAHPDPRYSITKLCDLSYGLFAAPVYLEKHGTPRKLTELKKHHCIKHTDDDNLGLWQLTADKSFSIQSKLATNSYDMQTEAAIAGKGIILVPCFLAAVLVHKGNLKQLLKKHPEQQLTLSLITRKNTQSRRVQLLRDHLCKALRF